jgi:hypothetical protein
LEENPYKHYVYQAPITFVGAFYLVLAAWLVLGIVFLETLVDSLGRSVFFGLVMLAFIIFYTCYFALAIAYKIEVWEDGRIRLTSLRKTFNTSAEGVHYIEGPFLPFGFIRFRLEREKGYLFAVIGDSALKTVLSVIISTDPDIKLKHLKV